MDACKQLLSYFQVADSDPNAYGKKKVLTVDNFALLRSMLKFPNNDTFYYVSIIQRAKDNPGKHIDYCNYLHYYFIRSLEQLDTLEPLIKAKCKETNSRAYIWLNARSAQAVAKYTEIYQKRHMPRQYRGHEMELAAGRSFKSPDRPICHFDIDTNDVNVYNDVIDQLEKNNVKIIAQYCSPSGGWHILTDDQEKVQKVDLKKFDGGKDKGRFATVGLEFDKPVILYYYVKDSDPQPDTPANE